MADLQRMSLWAVELDGTGVGILQGSGSVNNAEATTEEIVVASQERPSQSVILKKRPAFTFDLHDIDLITNFLEIGALKDFTDLDIIFRAKEVNGGWGAGYLTYKIGSGVIMPKQITSSSLGPATASIQVYATYTGGVAYSVVSTASVAAEVIQTKLYRPKTISIGTDTNLIYMESMNVQYNWTVQDDDQPEPAYYFYDTAGLTGSVVLKDLSKVSLPRLQDSTVESVSMTFEDFHGGGSDVVIDFGDRCSCTASIEDRQANFNFTALAT